MTRRRRHTEDFKREAVMRLAEKGYSVSEAARKLGVHVSLLRRCREELVVRMLRGLPGAAQDARSGVQHEPQGGLLR